MKLRSCLHTRSNPAFTLMEIMLVVMIIALLAGLAIFNMGDIFGQGQVASVRSNFRTYAIQLLNYRAATGNYPTTAQGLAALVTPPEGVERWRGPYMEKLDKDPWGSPFGYASPGVKRPTAFDIFSYGPDRQPNTPDDIWPE